MSTKNILVVEDEPLVEYVIQQGFRKEIKADKYHFTFASNGAEALEELLFGHTFNIVLTDLKMPKMDGFTFLDKLKKINPETKAVVISAYESPENTEKAVNLGVRNFLAKPIYLQDLNRLLEIQLYGEVLEYGPVPRNDFEAIERFRNHPRGLPIEKAIELYYSQKKKGFSIEEAFTKTLDLLAEQQQHLSKN